MLRATGRRSVLHAAKVGVNDVARDQARPDAAGNGLQLAVADQRADVLLGAAKLGGEVADCQRCGPLHPGKYRYASRPGEL
jgi:hypothetical protein